MEELIPEKVTVAPFDWLFNWVALPVLNVALVELQSFKLLTPDRVPAALIVTAVKEAPASSPLR
jgi:hypothetical protein